MENYSRGTGGTGNGFFEVLIPVGSTIRSATVYAFELNGDDDPITVTLNGTPYTFGTGTTVTGHEYATVYGPLRLHRLDLTDVWDPTVSGYVINMSPPQTGEGIIDVSVVVAYELPGVGEMTADLFWCDQNSTTTETYTITTSAPMLTASPIAFGTLASYCNYTLFDCEEVSVNGTPLGFFAGPDHNAASTFGTTASFHYSNADFVGLGTDTANMRIYMADALTEISTLVADEATTFQVEYTHCGHPLPSVPSAQDNLMNMMIVAYSSDICSAQLDLGPDTLLCAGETLLLSAARPGASYLWQDGSTSSTFDVSAPGTYYVSLGHASCNWEPDTVVVDYAADLEMDLAPDLTICENVPTMIFVQAVDGVTYVWNDGEVGPAREVTEAGTYTIVSSVEQCSATASIDITVEPCSLTVELPNIFTPNGDGINPLFAPIWMKGVSSMHLSIFNRWGQELFTSTDQAFRWDGRSPSGYPVPDGTYYWILRYMPKEGDGQELSQTGTVTITR